MKIVKSLLTAGLMVLGMPFLTLPGLDHANQAAAFDDTNIRVKYFASDPFYYGEGENNTMILAAHQGMAIMVQQLLDQGAEINARDDNGYTALIRAAQIGRADIVQMLLDRGADPTFHEYLGYSALMWAVAMNHTEAASVLIFRNSPVNWRIEGGPSAIEVGRSMDRRRLVAKMLNARNQSAFTIPNATDFPIRQADGNFARATKSWARLVGNRVEYRNNWQSDYRASGNSSYNNMPTLR